MDLNDRELRVLGCLIEKEMTTPDYYPMSLHSLVTACNQKSNRDPVVDYTEREVMETVDQLRERGLARTVHGKGDRVLKYRHVVADALEVGERQAALLAVLMLRGDQTLGELRSRTARYTEFTDLDDVAAELAELSVAETQLAVRLERRPGEKEARYRQLLGPVPDAGTITPATGSEDEIDRIAELESELVELRDRMTRMERELGLS
jgi:uncharacterized protein YceH (UPF0502 family)